MPTSRIAGVVDAVARSVDIERREDGVQITTVLSAPLGAAPTDLWPDLVEPERLAQWYGPVEVDRGPDDAPVAFRTVGGAHGRVVESVPPHSLALTWEHATGIDLLDIRLDPEFDGTCRFTLRQTGTVPADVFERFGPGATAIGWDIALLGLVARTGGWRELRLEVPTPSPLWLTSPEGAEHVRAWSIRWAAASIAAGTDEEAARRGEAESARAYGAVLDAAVPV